MLVTVAVITYNSSQFVTHTLESVLRQTHRDIELIISDDCSTDSTLSLCQSWAERHQARFRRVVVTQTPRNMGICGNYNHALSLAQGEYIKYIAGDDILMPDCIERFVVLVQPNAYLYFSADDYFYRTDSNGLPVPQGHYHFPLPNVSARKQLRLMLAFHYGLAGPTIFVQRRKLLEVCGFDMRFPMCEDWTIVMKFLSLGLRIVSTPERLVAWRVYAQSVSHSQPAFITDIERAKRHYDRTYCLRLGMPFHLYHHELERFLARHKGKGGWARYAGYALRCLDLVHIHRRLFLPPDPNMQEAVPPSSQDNDTPKP